MSNISSVQPGTSPAMQQQQAMQSEKDRTSMDKNDFLRLFMESLKYQDPMSPMQNSEMMQQLSQLGMMEQVTNMTMAVEKMASSSLEDQLQKGADLLGKTITASDENGETIQGMATNVVFNDGLMELIVNNQVVGIDRVKEIGLKQEKGVE